MRFDSKVNRPTAAATTRGNRVSNLFIQFQGVKRKKNKQRANNCNENYLEKKISSVYFKVR